MSKKLRVILKDGDRYATVLWVKLTSKFVMVSHTLLESYYQQFYPTGTNFHRHEIYFNNGDFHSSFKFYDQHNSMYIDRKIYPDTIVIKSSPYADFKISCLQKLPRDENNQDNAFIEFQLKPWTEPDIGHVFGSLAYRHTFDGLRHFHKFDKKDHDPKSDLMIDTRMHLDDIINVSAFFYKVGNPTYDNVDAWQTPRPPITKGISISDLRATVCVIIAPQKRSFMEKLTYFTSLIRSWLN